MPPNRVLVALGLVLLSPAMAFAQGPCDATCDHVVDGTDRRVDGAGIAPGETVCVRGGDALIPTLAIRDVHGSAAAPITVRACGASLRLGGGSSTNGLSIQASSHLRVTGGEDHAIQIVGGASYVMGVAVGSCTEHLEIDGLDVTGTSYTAYRDLSEDDACPIRTGFSLHDWLIHDVGGEGMFFGANLATSPYRLVGVEVFHNRVERTGMQGIKIGMTVDDAHVHDNLVIDAGTRDIAGEDTGITGGARSYFIERNVVLRTSASCIFASGRDVHVIDNVLVGCGDAGINTNGMAAMTIRILHNTMVGIGGDAFHMWSSSPEESAFVNNLVVDMPDGASLGIRESATWAVEGNLTIAMADAGFATTIDPATATFEDLSSTPFAIGASSPARDTGSLAVGAEVPVDVMGAPRDATPDVGAHELVAPAIDSGVMLADGGVATPDAGIPTGDAETRHDGSAERDASPTPVSPPVGGGCSALRTGSGAWWALLPLAAWLRRRRTR